MPPTAPSARARGGSEVGRKGDSHRGRGVLPEKCGRPPAGMSPKMTGEAVN
ncbi:MAG: hypothetical protein MZV70_03360 [Desulfobacterales bacterium]|nr:hypothetical protein [Desulfobacterales bacterium]